MFRRLYNRFNYWWHRKEIEMLILSFVDIKYPGTGIAQRPVDIVNFFQLNGIRASKANRVIKICILHNIIQDMPQRSKAHRYQGYTQSKQFYYILNPEFLK